MADLNLTDTQLRSLSQLLDRALDMDDDQRAAWLGQLDGVAAELRPILGRMLAMARTIEASDFLQTLPKLGAADGAAAATTNASSD